VLARLATEEPDLSGLPGELTELITACMARVPRQRPTSSSMLAQLGDFTEAQAGPDEEHAYLPATAMALIGQYRMREYQRGPQPAASASLGAETGEDGGDEATSASFTELPASYKPVPRRKPGTGASGPAGSGWRRWLRSHMGWAGWASVGAALVVVGVVLGAALSSSSVPNPAGSKQASGSLPPRPVAPETVCGTPASTTHGSALCMLNMSMGTADAAWVVQGRGFAPRSSVTVSLTWNSPPSFTPNQTFHHTAQAKPVVAPDGTVRLDINQLFPGSLRLGQFIVDVTGSGGSTATTIFIVIPAGG